MRRRVRPAAAALLALAALGCGGGDEPAARNLVLLTLDTTRSDAIGAFGGPPGLTPSLDRLAERAVAFDAARTVAPLTLPAHASMLTGLYPPRHGVRDNNLTPLPAEARTLAERAADAGLQTGAVVATAVLAPAFGLAQGFATYDAPERDGHGFAARPAAEVDRRAVAWLDGVPEGRRFFLWAHWFDPHRPLAPDPAHLAAAGGDPYHGCVAQVDASVGRVLDALRARSDWDDTLVVVVADHGEGNGDHGEGTHGTFVYDTTMKVPLLVRFPGDRGAGTRSDAVASVADVFATAVDRLGLPATGAVDGVSLARPVPPDRGVYFEALYGALYNGWSPLYGWADAEAKYVHASRPELYRPGVDPDERDDLVGEADVSRYVDAIAAATSAEPLAAGDERVDADLRADLEALGYAGGAAGGAAPGPLEIPPDAPSPHERAEELALIVTSYSLSSSGRAAEAERVIEEIVARNPRNHDAWSRLGRLRVERRDWPGAAEALERFAELGQPWPDPYLNLALAYRHLDRPADALAAVEHALTLAPDRRAALELAVDLALELNRPAAAAPYLERLETLGN